MIAPTPVRQLADVLATTLLDHDPMSGSALGFREYDAGVGDAGAAAEDRLLADLDAVATQARSVVATDPDDAVTLAAVGALCARRSSSLRMRAPEYTVAPMPISGPPLLMAVLARTGLQDPRAAEDYLARVRGCATAIDAGTERLREGMAKGRFPVGALVDSTIGWADRALAGAEPAAVMTPQPPDGWDRAEAWRAELAEAARESVAPALARWREQVVAMRPMCRDDDHAGLWAVPGGEADYAEAIAFHTTLTASADDLHRLGLEQVARLTEQACELGAQIGLAADEVLGATRRSTEEADPQAALETARTAVARAEAVAHRIMPSPLPPPCAVTPMPQSVAESGIAPHYTRPIEGGRPGTYWFNLHRATAGTGWDLEAVAFHEAVPGHHSQLARQQQIDALPIIQMMSVTAHSEGWGLYAERLAGEFGLYSDVRAELGATFIEMHRAARLVVDTGIHALGWSRQRAREYLIANVATAEGFLLDEIDRYIAWPGQALAYMSGQRQLLELRAEAESALGDAFDLPAFHGALLDHGNLPLPVLADVVRAWVGANAAEIRTNHA